MKTHELKTYPEYFEQIWEGKKDWELRKNDRNYKFNDTLILKEWDWRVNEYTGREIEAVVCYVLKGVPEFGLMSGYCILSLRITNYTDLS